MMIEAILRWIKNRSNIHNNVALIQKLLIASSQQRMRFKLWQTLEEKNRKNFIAVKSSRVSSDRVWRDFEFFQG
jgi:hypothetical protein